MRLELYYLSGTYYIARDNIYEQINNIKTLSMRLEALQGYAKNHPQNFYFYNALWFIGAKWFDYLVQV